MQTVSLPHYAKIPRTAAMLVAAAFLVAVLVLVLALVDVTRQPTGSGPGSSAVPARTVNPSPSSSLSSASCLFLHQPC
jgi:hypothetical protein